MSVQAALALYYLEQSGLEDPQALYGVKWEERQTEELLCFVREAMQEVSRRKIPLPEAVEKVRITRSYRIFIGSREVKVRPMAKSVLLLFLRHPEGIPLKQIGDYRRELALYYRKVSRSSDPEAIHERILRMLDLFNNELNVSISRVNRAVAALVDDAASYRIGGSAGEAKRIGLRPDWIIWEES